MSSDHRGENTYILDPENPSEMARLINLDRIATQSMGGPLVGLPEPTSLRSLLDMGCGPGGWVLDVAFAYPVAQVAGVDISRTMINYANARARTQGLVNASFGVMDITQPLDFSDAAFDVVNARFLLGVLRRNAWPSFLTECTRILRPGGVLRLTENVDFGITTSYALSQLNAWLTQAMCRAGYGFSPDERTLCMTPMLPQLLRQAGYQDIQRMAHSMEFSVNTQGWIDLYRNTEVAFLYLRPLFLKTAVATLEEIERVHQQALLEMRSDDFSGMWHFMSFWGTKLETSPKI